MLQWLKDVLNFAIRQNARRYDLIISLLTDQAQAVKNLTRKVDVMSSNIDRIEKEAADLAEDVPVVKQALEDLKTLMSDLKDQVAKGQMDQTRLDAAASKLEKVDDDLDALTTTPAEEPLAEGGESPA